MVLYKTDIISNSQNCTKFVIYVCIALAMIGLIIAHLVLNKNNFLTYSLECAGNTIDKYQRGVSVRILLRRD